MVARLNDAAVTAALLTQGAIISVLDKQGNKAFQKLIGSLGGDKKKVDRRPRGQGATVAVPRETPTPRGQADSRIPDRPDRAKTGAPPRGQRRRRSDKDLLGE